MVDEVLTQSSDVSEKEQIKLAGRAGIVYVLTNPGIRNEKGQPLVKIGKTTDLNSRLNSLGTHSGVPFRFDCVRAVEVEDMDQAEKALHKAFEPNRVNPRREFFEIEPEQATVLLELIGVRDITPGQDEAEGGIDVLELSASDRFKNRRPSMRFDDFEIPLGAQLKFSRSGAVATVVDDGTTVEYENEEYAISRLTGYLLGGSTEYVSPLNHWEYEGRRLREISDRVHGIG